MEWTLRLVGTGMDGQSRSFDVMPISRPDGLGEIANLGLTLAEAKLLLAQVQQQVVAAQADHRAMFRPDCQSCGRRYHAKGWRPHRIATLFGEVRVKLPRLACAGGCGETGGGWPPVNVRHQMLEEAVDYLQQACAVPGAPAWKSRSRSL